MFTHLYPTTVELARLRAVATGNDRPDLIVRNGLVQSPGTEEWLERASITLRIPMRDGLADSLNVSVAGAVVLYEALRQRSA